MVKLVLICLLCITTSSWQIGFVDTKRTLKQLDTESQDMKSEITAHVELPFQILHRYVKAKNQHANHRLKNTALSANKHYFPKFIKDAKLNIKQPLYIAPRKKQNERNLNEIEEIDEVIRKLRKSRSKWIRL